MKKYLHAAIALACALAPAWAVRMLIRQPRARCAVRPRKHAPRIAGAHLPDELVCRAAKPEQGDRRRLPRRYLCRCHQGQCRFVAESERLRLAEIADLLRTLSTTASFEVQTDVEEFESQSIKHPENLDVLNATVQPACAKTGSCCKGSEGPEPRPKNATRLNVDVTTQLA
jgi:hypothetical protein